MNKKQKFIKNLWNEFKKNPDMQESFKKWIQLSCDQGTVGRYKMRDAVKQAIYKNCWYCADWFQPENPKMIEVKIKNCTYQIPNNIICVKVFLHRLSGLKLDRLV